MPAPLYRVVDLRGHKKARHAFGREAFSLTQERNFLPLGIALVVVPVRIGLLKRTSIANATANRYNGPNATR
jgi:hypothetical protein